MLLVVTDAEFVETPIAGFICLLSASTSAEVDGCCLIHNGSLLNISSRTVSDSYGDIYKHIVIYISKLTA